MYFYDEFEKYADHVAVIEEDLKQISYAQFAQDCAVIAKNIPPRKLAFIICENSYPSLVCYAGCLRNRVVPLLLDENREGALSRQLLIKYRPDYIMGPEREMGKWGDAQVIFRFRHYVICKTSLGCQSELHPELALLLTTSGSTGSPKLVRISRAALQSNTEAISRFLPIDGADRVITTMPMNYTFGLSILNTHFYKGAVVVLNHHTMMEKEFWNSLRVNAVTTFGGVPYHYEILRKLRFEKMNIPTLKYLSQAGGKLGRERQSELAEICQNKNIQFFVMYGQTEATARMSYLPSDQVGKKLGSIGIPIPGGKFWLEDESGERILKCGEIGELVYQGANVSMGYAESDLDLVRGDDCGGVLHTGDLAFFDEDGYYYIAGRKRRFLKIFGFRINLDEVEGHLAAAGCVSACTGVDDHLQVYVEGVSQADQVRNVLTKKLGLHPTSFHISAMIQLPRASSGKILYADLEKMEVLSHD